MGGVCNDDDVKIWALARAAQVDLNGKEVFESGQDDEGNDGYTLAEVAAIRSTCRAAKAKNQQVIDTVSNNGDPPAAGSQEKKNLRKCKNQMQINDMTQAAKVDDMVQLGSCDCNNAAAPLCTKICDLEPMVDDCYALMKD